ncbi:MAG: recombinase family protein [Clostridiales bacterium]|jgi:DNA invertase Pin-like site-specific DNA recombinase|nr:recombinase family protein [Clostridiales bacterium]
MKQPRKTAIYCRTARADEHGHANVIPYRDSGAAGNSLDRPAMNELTADIKTGEIGAVLVADISRIARTLPLVSEWRELLFEHDVTLVIPASGETPRPAIEIIYIPAGDYLNPNRPDSRRRVQRNIVGQTRLAGVNAPS